MRALTILPGVANSARVDDVPAPPPSDGAVLVRALALGVCGTDREIVAGEYGSAPPGQERLILGHESFGQVEEAPKNSGFKPGDLVVGIVRHPDPVPCSSCAAGEWDMCRNGRYTEHGIKERNGFGAEYFRLEPTFAIKLDPTLGIRGVLMEPTSIVAKAWDHVERIGRRSSSWQGHTAVVTGGGPVGQLAALLGKQRGYDVHIVDRNKEGPKPVISRALGAHYHNALADLGDLKPDVVMECTGAVAVVRDVLERAAPEWNYLPDRSHRAGPSGRTRSWPAEPSLGAQQSGGFRQRQCQSVALEHGGDRIGGGGSELARPFDHAAGAARPMGGRAQIPVAGHQGHHRFRPLIMSAPIENYALIGDCESAALVGRNGSIDWLCWPRFDSDACFAALLGTPEHGRWLIAPRDQRARISRRYRPGTLILETRFETDEGAATIVDFMPKRDNRIDIVRLVVGERGKVAMCLELVIRFGYGAIVPWVTRLEDGTLRAIAGPDMLLLRTPVHLRGENLRTVAEFTIEEGESIPFVLTHVASNLPLPST